MNAYFLIINVGSTSVKTALFSTGLLAQAFVNADYGEQGLTLEVKAGNAASIHHQQAGEHDAKTALAAVFSHWQQLLAANAWKVVAIGHRVVHGGDSFTGLVAITDDLLARLPQLDAFAPLHNPINRLGMAMAAEALPSVAQFAVFDTAFHRQIPGYAGRYALPNNLPTAMAFYRYGFHGISCQHSVTAAAELLGKPAKELNLIILHLGGGASATAVRNGVSVDTSMGFSPTEGLMMASRCGDIDPMIAIALQKSGMTLSELEAMLNHQCGLKGVAGDTDMRLILHRAEQNEPLAVLALAMFCYRIKKYIGAYYAILGDLSALVFTGGIGFHAASVRSQILQGMAHLGLVLDEIANSTTNDNNQDISAADSRSRILVVNADEEREIARQIQAFLGY